MSIWTDIISTLETAIDAMTTPTFNYSYDNVNENRPASKTYPSVIVNFPEEIARDPDINMIDSYSVDTEVLFEVTVDDAVADTRLYMDNVLEDFKRLLEDEHDNLQLDGLVVGDLISADQKFSNVRQRPGTITIIFSMFYRVKRSDPSLTT